MFIIFRPRKACIFAAAAAMAILFTACPREKAPPNEPAVVFAGIGLSAPVVNSLEIFKAETGIDYTLITGDSGELSRTIGGGAECDVFIPDAPGAIDFLAQRELAGEENVKFLFLERLAVVIFRAEGAPPSLEGQNAVEFVRHARKIAVLSPTASRSGLLANESLEFYGAGKGESEVLVLPALSSMRLFLEKAEADCAIVFASEIHGEDYLTIVDYLPPESHTPYAYPLVLLPGAKSGAQKLADFLLSPDARKGYMQFGYDRPDEFDRDISGKPAGEGEKEGSGDTA